MPEETSASLDRPTRLEAYYEQEALWRPGRFEANYDQRLRARVIAALVDPEVENILDVGCGNGFVTRHLKARGQVVGLDASEAALANFEGPHVVGRCDNLPFADRSFDAVVCTEVLEHLPADVFARTIAELNRVARRYLVIGVPYREDLRAGLTRCAECGQTYHTDLHQRTFNGPDDILRHFPGFTQQACVLVGSCPRIRSRLFRWLRHVLLGPAGRSDFARCPDCGSARTRTYRDCSGRRLRRWLFEGLAWRMPRNPAARWMILRIRRPNESLQS